MKKDLNKIRQEINKIDFSMKELFIQRMNLIKEVIKYKIDNNIDILDSSREEEVISLNSKELIDSEFYSYYIQYLKDVMNISKEYQSNFLKNKKDGE